MRQISAFSTNIEKLTGKDFAISKDESGQI
jgi:hypothetical protein